MEDNSKKKKLDQFFTPVWAAEILFDEHFSHVTNKDLVWEPTCGDGSFLSAIPKNIPAIGSELDPELVTLAKENTGRPVYQGDFRNIDFEEINEVTAIIGNPPFKLDIFEQFMQRCETILSIGNKASFILPAYFFQTSKTFMRFARRWQISQEILPRDLFQSQGLLSKPIIFASFVRENSPLMFGFRLHAELCDINNLNKSVKDFISTQVKRSGSIWKEMVVKIAKDSGGKITLEQLYKTIEAKRPTENPFWKEQVRKVVQQHPFQRIEKATYQLN